jgi:glycine/D-amino acid oxidase-like deaminating enzyme
MKPDIVVIGAGALGLSTALHGALLGRSVLVIERDTAGSQASGRAAGLFKSVQADELRTELARRSISRAVSFADWAGVPLDVCRSGSFLVARTSAHMAYLGTEARQSRSWGADVSEAAPGALASRAGYYRGDGSEVALWCPEDVYIEEPMSLIWALVAACRARGVEIAESEAVTGITLSGGRVTGVETARRPVAASVVVDAAGAWTGQVAELAGASLALAPVRHQLLITEPAAEVDPAAPIVRVVDAAVYLRPARDGLMLGGFEADPLPVDLGSEAPSFRTADLPLDLAVLAKMAGQVAAEVPLAGSVAGSLPGGPAAGGPAAGEPAAGGPERAGPERAGPERGGPVRGGPERGGPVRGGSVAEHRGGMFTMSPDGRFVAGPVPDVPGLWVASGCNGSGFSSSLAIGEALAGWIADMPGRLDISALGPARFGRLTQEALVRSGVWQYAHYYDPAGAEPA